MDLLSNGLSQIAHTFQTKATDSAGNTGLSSVITVTVDATPPSLEYAYGTPSDGSIQNSTSANVIATTSDANGQHSVFTDWNNSLVGWWKLNGDVTDSSGNDNHGTNHGATATAGKLGQAMSFDGVNNYVGYNNLNINFTNSFTMSGWFKLSSFGDPIFGYASGGWGQARFYNNIDGTLLFSSYSMDGEGGTVGLGAVNIGEYYFVSAVGDGSTINLYLNGNLVNSKIQTAIGTPGTEFYLGTSGYNRGFFDGILDDVQIYNRALSLDEVKSLYDASAKQYQNLFENLAGGSYPFRTYAQDLAGNVATGDLRTFTVDTTAPTAGTVTVPVADVYQSATSYTWHWNAGSDGESGLHATTPYHLYTYTNSGCSTGTADQGTTASVSMTVSSGLVAGNSYWAKVVYMDKAGNTTSSACSTYKVVIDSTPPTVTINQAGGQADPTNTSPINFTVVFSEVINPETFTSADITTGGTVTGVTWSSPTTSDNITWTISTSAITTDGTVIPSIAINKVTDPAGNNNAASTSTDNSVTYDTTPPTTSNYDPADTSTINNTTPTITFNTNERGDCFISQTNYSYDDMASHVAGGGAVDCVENTGENPGTIHTCQMTDLSPDGPKTIYIACEDYPLLNKDTTGSTDEISYTLNAEAPNNATGLVWSDPSPHNNVSITAAWTPSDSSDLGSQKIQFYVYTDDSCNAPSGDLISLAKTATTRAFTGVSGVTYAYKITSIDTANNEAVSGCSLAMVVDTTSSTVTINQAVGQADPTNTSPINFTVVFSEPTTDFATGDVSLTGTAGATAGTVTGSGTTYNVAISGMTEDGTVIASIDAGVAHDSAGNPNDASTSTDHTITYDHTAPTGGSITYANGYFITVEVPITYDIGTDPGSGFNNTTGKIQRAVADLSAGVCDTFSSFTDLVAEFDGSYTDITVVTGHCYKYQYLIQDNTTNQATYTSGNVAKIDTYAPETLTIDFPVNSASYNTITWSATPFSWTCTDSASGCDVNTCEIYTGGDVYVAPCLHYTPTLDENYTIKIKEKDIAGNEQTSSTVSFVYDNVFPIVDAGSNQEKGASFIQYTTASDTDSGISSYLWEKVSGPGTVTFAPATSKDTIVHANLNGDYILKLTATDNAGNSASDTFNLTWDFSLAGGGGVYIPTPETPTTPTTPETPTTIPPTTIVEQIQQVPEALVQQLNNIAQQIANFVNNQPAQPEIIYPPIAEMVPEETPIVFQGGNIISQKQFEKINILPLPDLIKELALKFPKFASTLESVGISSPEDVEKLRVASLTFPSLSEVVGSTSNIAIANFTQDQLQKIPSNVTFARTGSDNIDFNIHVSVADLNKPIQSITTLENKPLYLTIKPDNPASSVKGYILFKSAAPPVAAINSTNEPSNKLTASLLEATNLVKETKPVEEPAVQKELVLSEFNYVNNNGIWTAEVSAPSVSGTYEVKTVVQYKEKTIDNKTTESISMILVVDPEGYVYEKAIGNKETRIDGAKVFIYWLNPEGPGGHPKYELWPAKQFLQTNPQTTDITGKYSFLVPIGTYYIEIESKDYLAYKGEPFKVDEGLGIHENIELKVKNWWLRVFTAERIMLGIIIILLASVLGVTIYRKNKLKVKI